jgi:hypothetical protein
MALLFGLLGGSAISAGGSLLGASMQSDARNQALSNAQNQINTLSSQALGGNFLGQFGATDIFGSTPNAALYQPVAPVDFYQNQLDTIGSNISALPSAEALSTSTNAYNLGQAQQRIGALVPNYQANLDQMGAVTKSLLLGQLPYSDVLDITGNRSSLAASLGTPGGSANATLKDLGLSQLSAETQGANMFETMLQGAQQVFPTSMLSNPSSMFYDPTTLAGLQLQQNAQNIEQAQLVQQSSQSANNLAAAANPAASSLFNLNASLIPATLNLGNNSALGAGISNAASALGGGLSSYSLLNALKQNQPTSSTVNTIPGFNMTGYNGGYLTSAGNPQVNQLAAF